MQQNIQPKLIDLIEEGSKVIDLGCGDGQLLHELVRLKSIKPLGLEIGHDSILECVQKDVPVLQLDIDKGLTSFSDNQFDIAVLRYTIQELKEPLFILKEMLRVARSCIIVFANFAYWKIRFRLLLGGQMPKTSEFPHEWYNTPNIHLMSIRDIETLCQIENAEVLNQHYFGNSAIDNFLIQCGQFNFGASTALIHMRKRS